MAKSMLYTRTGDAGETSLIGGARTRKNSLRVNAYGTIDELNSHIGLVTAYCESLDDFVHGELLIVSNLLFNVGAYLANPTPDAPTGLTDADLQRLEEQIDLLDSMTPPMKSFVLPGGCKGAAVAHIARTVCRRAERDILTLADSLPAAEEVSPLVLRFINRLSDYLFALARYINHFTGTPETPWLPAKPEREG